MSAYSVDDALQEYLRDSASPAAAFTEKTAAPKEAPASVDLEEASTVSQLMKQASAILSGLSFDVEEEHEKQAAAEPEVAGDFDEDLANADLVNMLFNKLAGVTSPQGGTHPSRTDTMGQPPVPGGSDALLGNDRIPNVTRRDTKKFVIPELKKLLGSAPPKDTAVVTKNMDTSPQKGGLKFSSAKLHQLLREGA